MEWERPGAPGPFAAACSELAGFLESEWGTSGIHGLPAIFRVYGAGDFAQPIQNGVSILLLNIQETPTRDTVIELHVLLTVWAADAATEHALADWTFRTLWAHPVLSLGEIVSRPLPSLDLVRLWQAATGQPYRLSLSYLIRVAR